MIVPSQWVLKPHGPALNGVGGTTRAPQLPGTVGFWSRTHARSCGICERRFIQSTSRTPEQSVHTSPLPGQLPPVVLSEKNPRAMHEEFRRTIEAASAYNSPGRLSPFELSKVSRPWPHSWSKTAGISPVLRQKFEPRLPCL